MGGHGGLSNLTLTPLDRNQFSFSWANISGSATFDMSVLGFDTNTEYTLPYDGSILAISVAANTELLAGTIVWTPEVNGGIGEMSVRLDATNRQYNYAQQGDGRQPFNAGERLTVRQVSTADIEPDNEMDVVVTVVVGYNNRN